MCRVAIVTNIPSPYRVDLFYYMQTHITEHEFHVIYTSKNEDNRSWDIPEEKLMNSRILDAKILKVKNNLDTRYIHLPANIGRELSKIMPDVVVAMEYNPAALQALFWTKLHRKGFVHWTDGTLHSERNIGKVQKLTRKIICGNADSCIASSTKAKEKLLAWGVPEERIFISLLTVDIAPYLTLKRDPVPGRILYVGRITRGKGLELLLEALQYVKQDFELRIVGDGEAELVAELKEEATSLGMADKIAWCGYKSGTALEEEYSHAQVFVLPTKDDCFGLVLLEAMCAGVPIVASKYADGAYDIVIDGKNGYIQDPFAPKKFGGAINLALKSQAELISDKEQIEKFALENVSKAYVASTDYVMRQSKSFGE